MVRENLPLLSQAGVRAVLHSDSPELIQHLNQEAAKALAAGRRAGVAVDRNAALAWITLNAAWMLGIDELTGSIEPGKMADVVVWSGDPFSVYSVVDAVYVDGRLVYDRFERPRRPSDFELGQLGSDESTLPTGPGAAAPTRPPRADDAFTAPPPPSGVTP
jgi:adenine deaminase